MTFRCMAALRASLLVALLVSSLAAQSAPEEAILLIEQTTGVAGVQRDGKRLALQPGDALQEQDLIVTDRSGRMTLRLGRHGFVEIGPNAEVGVERLPFAAYARDLKSIFSVGKGYFRVVWKHPQLSSNWPLYVYMTGHRISLMSGEYFFQNTGSEQRACVAAGQLALQAASSESADTIKPPSCVLLAANAPPLTTPRSPDDWIAVRRGFSIEATALTLLARETLPAEPVLAAVPRPVINTTPTGLSNTALPVAIDPPEPAPSAEINTDWLASTPEAATPTVARSTAAPLGPVMDAPVLPAPPAVPKTAITPALPIAAKPASPSAVVISSPIIIGMVQAAPVTSVKPVPVAPYKSAINKVAAPPVGVPSAPSTVGWALNVASYSDAAIASREAERLRGAGYASAFTQTAQVNGKTWHRVQVSGFASEAAARSTALSLKTSLGFPNIWVLRQP